MHVCSRKIPGARCENDRSLHRRSLKGSLRSQPLGRLGGKLLSKALRQAPFGSPTYVQQRIPYEYVRTSWDGSNPSSDIRLGLQKGSAHTGLMCTILHAAKSLVVFHG